MPSPNSKPTTPWSHRMLPTVAASLFLSSPVSNAEPHVHGIAELQVAIEGRQADVIFTSPAANLVGFEHAPESDAQRRALEDATRFLQTRALLVDEAGSCTLVDAAVSSELLDVGHEEEAHDEHDDDHHEHEEGHGEHDDQRLTHSGFTVTQRLMCEESPLVLHTPLLERFERIESLRVQWIANATQGSVKLNNGNTEVRFER